MSKIGKQIIKIPTDVKVNEVDGFLVFKKGDKENRVKILPGVKPILTADELKFELISDTKQHRSNWGTLAALCANAVIGLISGFEKTLLIEGIGYKVAQEGDTLVFNLGFSHSINYKVPAGVEVIVEKNKIIRLKSHDKILLGQVAAQIRSLRKPEPYKGKGIRYENEVIKLKAGKKAVGATA